MTRASRFHKTTIGGGGGGAARKNSERNRGTKRRHDDKPELADYVLVRVGYVLMVCQVVRWERQGVIRR
jgi:hypothetical protein